MSRVPASYQSFPLTLVSWNISNAHPSFSAPDSIRRWKESPRLIREECLSSSPDIIALQEAPHPLFGHEEFGPSGYVSMGTQPSHCGYVDLLVRKELANENNPSNNIMVQKYVQKYNLLSVAATLELPNKATISVSSSHLAPFKEGAFQRRVQYMTLMELQMKHANNCILLGDCNMRAAEDADAESAFGSGWVDAWKESGSNPNLKFAWNSFMNNYHEGGFKFKARFDRCYISGEELSVRQFGFIGNKPVEKKKGDYLSDHFGLKVELDVASNISCNYDTDEGNDAS